MGREISQNKVCCCSNYVACLHVFVVLIFVRNGNENGKWVAMEKEMKFWIWRFRVCLVGLRWHHRWCWNDIDTAYWLECYEDRMTPEDQYIEGWCRE